ncbi:hypothetical protein KBD20_00065 [Candidatus Saccharibacteria bacterium]|nr:hypothetical protein [Candidatus Saccharibacteria bacterium]
MERDPFIPEDRSPEKKWDFFEKPEEKDEEAVEKPKKKWFFEKEDTKAPSDDETKKNPKDAAASEKDLEKLSPEEQKHVLAKQYVANRAEQLREELGTKEPGSAEAIEVTADLELIAALDEKLDNPELEVDEAVEEAYQQIMERLDEILQTADEELSDDLTEEVEPTEALEETTEEVTEDTTESPIWVNPTNNPPRRNPQVTQPQTSRGTTTPGGQAKPTPKSESTRMQPQTESVPKHNPESTREVRKKRAGSFAVSEALSQMLGRRYESPAEAVPQHPTENPERVINPIRRTIAEKERRVRKLAIEQVVSSPVAEEVSTALHSAAETPTYSANQMPYFEGNPIKLETVHSAPNHIAENQLKRMSDRPVTKETNRNLQQASTSELLQIGDKIKIDGTSLRSLYASNKIDRDGLTKIIKEALKGGDVKGAISKATLGAEAQRGRAIEMRHDDLATEGFNGIDVTSQSAAAQQRTDQILEALKKVNHTTATELEKNTSATGTVQPEVSGNKKLVGISIAAAVAISITGIITAVLFLL